MADLNNLSVGAVLGGGAAIGVVLKIWWDVGDRATKKLAATILSSEIVYDAIGKVSLSYARKSKEFVGAEAYASDRERHDEKFSELKKTMDDLNNYLRSDQLAQRIAAAVQGEPTRRMHGRSE